MSLPFSLRNFLQHFFKYSSASDNLFLPENAFICLHFWSTVALHIEFLVSIFFFLPSALQIYYSNVFCSHSFLLGSQPLLMAIPVYAIFLLRFSCLHFITVGVVRMYLKVIFFVLVLLGITEIFRSVYIFYQSLEFFRHYLFKQLFAPYLLPLPAKSNSWVHREWVLLTALTANNYTFLSSKFW